MRAGAVPLPQVGDTAAALRLGKVDDEDLMRRTLLMSLYKTTFIVVTTFLVLLFNNFFHHIPAVVEIYLDNVYSSY